jgi:hypothetical protein
MGKKRYTVNGERFTIPLEKEKDFLKDFPNAEEVHSYEVGKETFHIPVSKEQDFLRDMPDAKPLGSPVNLVQKNASWVYDDKLKKKEDSGSTSEVQESESKESTSIDFSAPPPSPKFEKEALGQPPVDDQSVDYLTPQQTKQKDDTVAALKEQLPFIKKTIADIDEKAKINIGGNVLFGFGKEQGDLLTARRYLKSAEKLINSPTEEGVKSFWAGIKRNDLTNLLSLGSTEAYRSIKTANIANKIKNGEEPTDEEYLVMAGRFMYDIANQNIDSPSSYRIGQAFAEMAPFIGQLYVSAPIGAAVSKAAASTTSKVISKEAVNILKKYGIDDVLKVATQAAAQTPFTPMLFQRYGEERMPSLSVSDEGKIVPTKGGESRVEAVADAFGSTVSTIFSEKVGEVIKGRVTNWGKKAAIAMDDPTKALSSIQKFRKDANWSGLGYEFAEEQIDGIGQAITTEEATLSDLLDSKRQFETLATIMVAGGAMKAVEIPGYFKTKQYKKDLDKATELFKSRVDPHTVEVVDAAINTDDIDQMRERLQNEDLSYLQPEQQKAVLDYMKAKIENNVLFEAANTKVEKDENKPPETPKPKSEPEVSPEENNAPETLLGAQETKLYEDDRPTFRGKKFTYALYDPLQQNIVATTEDKATGTGSHKAFGDELAEQYEQGRLYMIIPGGKYMPGDVIANNREGKPLDDTNKRRVLSMIEFPAKKTTQSGIETTGQGENIPEGVQSNIRQQTEESAEKKKQIYYHGTKFGEEFDKFTLDRANEGVSSNAFAQGNNGVYLTNNMASAKYFSRKANELYHLRKNINNKRTTDEIIRDQDDAWESLFGKTASEKENIKNVELSDDARIKQLDHYPNKEEVSEIIKSGDYDAVSFPERGFEGVQDMPSDIDFKGVNDNRTTFVFNLDAIKKVKKYLPEPSIGGQENAVQESQTNEMDVRQQTEKVVQEKHLRELAEEYGFSVNEYEGEGQEGGFHSSGDNIININKNTTKGTTTFYLKGVPADMKGSHTVDLPANKAILYHEIGHKLFSDNPDKGHSILKEIKRIKEENDFGHPTEYSVVKDDALESMMEFFAFYKLAPDKLRSTQPRVYDLMRTFDTRDRKETLKTTQDANEVNAPTSLPLGDQAGISQEVRGGNTGQQEVTGESQIQEPAKEAPRETLQEVKVSDLLEKEEAAKKSESGFLPFILSLPILRNPRAKRRALDIKQILREQFLPSRGMPKAVYNEFLKTKGRINARRFDIERSANKAKEDLYKAYGGKLTPEQKEEIEIALENLGTSKASKDIAFNVLTKNIPKEAQGIIEKMRNMIDSYSDDIKKLDMIGAGLEGKMDQNTGYYVTRTYRKHTDRDWTWDTISLKIKEDAANKLLEIFPKLTADEALGMAKEMVESKDFSDSVIRKGNSLADIDQRSLKKRSLFLTDNPEIRALYGENRDPLYNYAVSLTRMAEIAERGKMLENIRDLGLREGFLSETQSYDKNHIAQIQYNEGVFKGKLGTKPLSSYYTTPEIAKAISNFMEPASPPGNRSFARAVMRLYMSVITTTKIAKTAGSVKGIIRNFKTNITNALANGNWNILQVTSHIASIAKDKTAWNDFRRELVEENIVGDSSNAGELIKNVEELSNRISEVTRSDESFGEMLKRTTVDKALKVYGWADDIWKVFRYVSEKLKYKDAFVKTGMTEADAELAARKEASKILHKTSTYHSELPLFIQNMRKLPFTNTFVSFPYQTLTNYIGGIQQAVKEIKTPGLAHIGLQRLAGSLAATYVLTATSQFRNKEEGVDEKDLEAWRRFLPDYWRNDIITIKKDNGDGTAEYINTSYMDYYGVITTPLAMLRRKLVANGTLTDEDLIDAATEFSKSFIGWDIAFDKLTQLKANQDDLGRQIFNPQDEWDDKWKDMLRHLWGTVEPGTLTDIKRMIITKSEGGDWEGQLKGMLTGNQVRTIDPLKSMDYYILPKYKRQMDNARAIYKNQLRQYKRLVAPTDADNTALQKAKERAEAIINSILSEVILDYDAAIRVGVKQDKLEDVIRGEKFDKDITNAILYRTGLMLDEEGGFLEDTSKTNK